jgi:hypothetical protein
VSNISKTGYSGTPLPKKLGLKDGMTVTAINAPPGFLSLLQQDNSVVEIRSEFGSSDVFILFSVEASEMETLFHQAVANIPADGAIWVAWPKRSSGVATDLDENWMREAFLPTGFVDNKVCAIDEIWSGLRFVVRKENRAAFRG